MNFFARLIISAATLMLVTYIVPGITVDSFYTALVAALALGLLNAVVRPVLVILTLPITILTLGIFIFIINASLFLFVASFVDGFEVSGLVSALIGSILVSIISGIANKLS
ncbi:MAG: phage holin family protein [Candidatus Pacebacteria bacterium]|nr:phage holin family protein [Candidatus Paceibacterota bacterium]MCF7856966.1 phage holin family protein [Candidatus Paceibacterota bacterium]